MNWAGWWRDMRTIITLLIVLPAGGAVVMLMTRTGERAWLYGDVSAAVALTVGFPIDWWRLQRRLRRRGRDSSDSSPTRSP